MEARQLTLQDLAGFTGTDNWYRHPVVKRILYTDGIRHMMIQAAAYCLIDEIAFQPYHPRLKSEELQVWTLTVNFKETTGILTCDDGNGRVLYATQIPYTDFPLAEIKIYFTNDVMLLPSEN